MKLTPSEQELFAKLKIRTLLDLALLLPRSYQDSRLSKSLEIGSILTARVLVKGSFFRGGRFRVLLFLPDFKREITAIFFKSSSYHRRVFQAGESFVVQGKVGYFGNSLQIAQPKVLSSFGKITPIYKRGVQESKMVALIKKFVTKERLLEEGLTPKEAKALLVLHFPTKYNWQEPTTKYSAKLIEILKTVEALNHIKKLKSKKVKHPALASLNGSIEEFVQRLPFELTAGQKRAITEIRKDLSRESIASRRIVIGDVGSGKTMVILASAMIAREFGSILMAPTSILANQLYSEAKKYLSNFMKIALVTQSRREGEIEDAKLIIGTHALLYCKNLPKTPLIMVDEQHRFGSNQRQKLEQLSAVGEKRAHFLQFSATPIPRTQAMMESAMVDISLIEGSPIKREIVTQIMTKADFPSLIEHINREISQKKQVIIVYPLVESSSFINYLSIDEAREFWEKRYRNLCITHGKDREKERILEKFREDGDILLTTTVVEVGISLPRLSTIVIVGAERLGLASLHQLRGRVARESRKGWCYLFTNLQKVPKRLEEFSKTEDGFEIARLDLLYRDSGDILDGKIQSGKKFKWLDLLIDEKIVKEAIKRV